MQRPTTLDRLKGLLVVIALASAWAALVCLTLLLSGTLKTSESGARKVLLGLMLGPIMGGTLALVVHSFLAKVLDWLSSHVKFVGIAVFVAIKIPYYCFAWPGIKIGEALGLVSFAPGAAPQVDDAKGQAASNAPGRCPFEGRIYSNEGHPKLLYRIRPDWKVELEHQSDWGYIDAKGQIRKHQGPNPFRLAGPPLSPYEEGYDPKDPAVLADGGVLSRVDGGFCLKGAYDADVIGKVSLGDGTLL